MRWMERKTMTVFQVIFGNNFKNMFNSLDAHYAIKIHFILMINKRLFNIKVSVIIN